MAAQQAIAAIYIDCEGNEGKPPAFVSMLVDDVFEQIVLEESLRPAALQACAKPHSPPRDCGPRLHSSAGTCPRLRFALLPDVANALVRRAKAETDAQHLYGTSGPGRRDRQTLVSLPAGERRRPTEVVMALVGRNVTG
jgi:hypothetical protein